MNEVGRSSAISEVEGGQRPAPDPDDGGDAAVIERLRAENAQLTSALGRRAVIGQAMGILMERQKIPDTEAFDLLRKASQAMNVKLYDVAEYLTRTGNLPAGGR